MESPKEQQEIAGSLTFAETQRLTEIGRNIKNLLDHPNITEERFRDITNILLEVTAVREIYLSRLLNVFKRGYVIT